MSVAQHGQAQAKHASVAFTQNSGNQGKVKAFVCLLTCWKEQHSKSACFCLARIKCADLCEADFKQHCAVMKVHSLRTCGSYVLLAMTDKCGKSLPGQ